MSQQRPQPGRKRRRYKTSGCLKNFHHWVSRSKYTRKQAARLDRRNAKITIREDI